MFNKSVALLLTALSAVALVHAASGDLLNRTTRYDNQMLVQTPRTPQVVKAAERLHLDIWGKSPTNLEIRVTQAQYRELLRTLPHNSQVKVINKNIQQAIDAETTQLRQQLSKPQAIAVGPEWHKAYHQYDDIVSWSKELAKTYSSLVKFEPSIGKSVQGRDIPLLRITGPGDSASKKRVWLQGLQHAREWISGATMQYLADSLAGGYASDSRIKGLLDQVEVVIVPVSNPDGYVYTWSTDRLWRKNRGANGSGVDVNRNWPDHWGKGGSSNDPDDETYMGTAPGSEPEIKALMSGYQATPNVIAAVDFHSYSQLVLRPYGWTQNRAPDEAALSKVGALMRDAIAKSRGTRYTNQRVVDLYVASGGSNDWWYGLGTPKGKPKPYGMAVELPPAGGFNGFVLPPDQIVPVGTEILPAVLGMIEYALANPLGNQQ